MPKGEDFGRDLKERDCTLCIYGVKEDANLWGADFMAGKEDAYKISRCVMCAMIYFNLISKNNSWYCVMLMPCMV